jgi:GNAT superfamily N-acetyltransferase
VAYSDTVAVDADELLAVFDAEVRTAVPERLAEGVSVDLDGPVVRFLGMSHGGFVVAGDLRWLDGDEVDGLIARQVAFFSGRGERFEWKTYGHDRPDLVERLRAAGFEPETQETLLIARAAEIAAEPRLPDGVAIREVTALDDLYRIEALEAAVWGENPRRLAQSLAAELAADAEGLTVVVAESGDEVVCASWMRFEAAGFATFWGGATLPAWRRLGIYRALVSWRANLALERGYRYLQVDASEDSRPILERLGFAAVTTTTPYIWTPPEGSRG